MNILDLLALAYCPMTLFRYATPDRSYGYGSTHVNHAGDWGIDDIKWISPYSLVKPSQWADVDRAFQASTYHAAGRYLWETA